MSAGIPYCLSIAGFDPSGGAGLLADVKTFEQWGVYGLATCSAITFQTENEFNEVSWVPFFQVEKQLQLLLGKYPVEFVKIGLIENLEELDRLIGFFRAKFPGIKLIWDPILKASAGFEFHPEINQKLLPEILKNIFLITPNEYEVQKLAATSNALQAATGLSSYCHVFVKSIYKDELFGDCLFEKNGEQFFLPTINQINKPKHGSGCVLSSALTASLALGNDLKDACKNAREYTAAFLRSSDDLLGFHHSIKLEEHA